MKNQSTLDGNVCRVSSRCELCFENGCNRRPLQQPFCYDCSSENDENCISDPTKTANKTCEGFIRYDYRGCFTWVENDKERIRRGCFHDLPVDEMIDCVEDKNCERCFEGLNCNDQVKDSSSSLNSLSFLFFVSVFLNICAHKQKFSIYT